MGRRFKVHAGHDTIFPFSAEQQHAERDESSSKNSIKELCRVVRKVIFGKTVILTFEVVDMLSSKMSNNAVSAKLGQQRQQLQIGLFWDEWVGPFCCCCWTFSILDLLYLNNRREVCIQQFIVQLHVGPTPQIPRTVPAD